MSDEQQPTLAATLAALLHSEHVSVSHVMRYSGLARNTIEYILSGKTVHPKTETLRRIAQAIATDAYTGEHHRQKAHEVERELSIGAGYADPTAREAHTFLETALYYVLASREKARAWIDVILTLRGVSAETVRRIVPLVQRESGSHG